MEKKLPSASFPKGIDSGPYSVVVVVVVAVVVVVVAVVVVVVQGNVTTAAPLLPLSRRTTHLSVATAYADHFVSHWLQQIYRGSVVSIVVGYKRLAHSMANISRNVSVVPLSLSTQKRNIIEKNSMTNPSSF